MRCVSALVLLLLVGACADDRPPPPRGAETVGATGTTTVPGFPETQREAEVPERRLMGPIEIREPGETTTEEAPEEERDLSAELRAAIGTPAGCGSLGDRNGQFDIRFSANVTENGIVSRANVSGPIPAPTIDCLTQRLARVRLLAPIPGGASVTTTMSVVGSGGTPERVEPQLAPPAEPIPGVQPVQEQTGQAISGPSGRAIGGPSGETIEGPSGRTIAGPSGTMIDGPSGRPIGQ